MTFRSCITLFLCLFFLNQYAAAFKFELPPDQVRCFREDLAIHTVITGVVSTQVNLSMQLKFWVESNNLRTLYYSENVKDNVSFTFSADVEGEYKYCFINSYLVHTTEKQKRPVGLTVSVETLNQVKDEKSMEPIDKVLQLIKNSIDVILLEGTRNKERRLGHKAVAETLNFRVVWLSLLSITLLILSSVFQVYYIHRYLKKTKWID